MPPRFSVWVSTRQGAPFVAACVRSLLNQSCKDWEAVFVDDCSDDATFDHARDATLDDPRFTLIHNNRRRFQTGVFLQIFPLLTGDVIVELDGDDWFCDADALAKIAAAYAADPEIDATVGDHLLSNTNSRKTPKIQQERPRFMAMHHYVFAPRTWKRELTTRALAELPETFLDPGGVPWQSAGDVAIFAHVLHYARKIGNAGDAIYMVNLNNPMSDWVVDPKLQLWSAQAIVETWRKIEHPSVPRI